MPIFMDRHDVSEFVTAENVADLHKEDLKIQDKFNCRGLTYWFDDIKKIAFCLIDAPSKKSIQEMHSYAHGEVPNQVIEVDAKLVESFLGRIEDPVNVGSNEINIISDPAQRTLMVIRFMKCSLKDCSISQLEIRMRQPIQSIRDVLNLFEGRLVKQNESYLLISFKSVNNAVQAALEVNKSFKNLKESSNNSGIKLKMGLDTGMPVNKEKPFFEETTNMADYLCLIENKDIIISTEVKNMCIIENEGYTIPNNELHSISSNDEKFLELLMEFIEKKWRNVDLKVDDFGNYLGISKTLAYRKMMLLFGKSPSNFIKEYRLNRALEQLNLKTETISEIAFETGFNSTSYFSKCFHKRFHILPSDYIKS